MVVGVGKPNLGQGKSAIEHLYLGVYVEYVIMFDVGIPLKLSLVSDFYV